MISTVQIILIAAITLLFAAAMLVAYRDAKFEDNPIGRKCWIEFKAHMIPGVVLNSDGHTAYVRDDSGEHRTVKSKNIRPRYGML